MNRATVGDYMTTDVVCLRPDDGFKVIVRALAERGVSGAPVVDEGRRVIGVLSEADLLHKEEFKTTAEEAQRYFASRRRHAARDKTTGDSATELMSSPAVTVAADAPIAKAARIMAEHGVKRLPVIGSDGALVGIFSRGDLMGVFLTPDRQLREEIIAEVIERSLWEDPARIHVHVDGGVVTLSGRLALKSLVPIAIALTKGIDGVVDVVDKLTYARDDSVPKPSGHRR
jgi:CBS domain-containing protein